MFGRRKLRKELQEVREIDGEVERVEEKREGQMAVVGPTYLRQEGDKGKHGEETDGRSPKEGS